MVGLVFAGCSFTGPAETSRERDGAPPGEVDSGPASDAASDAPGCPAGYTPNPFGSCYRAETATPRSWQEAEVDCESEGAHLVVVDSADEDAAIPDYHWIGYSETIQEGTFVWVTGPGSSSYESWAPSEPDSTENTYCVVTRPDDWHDDNCFEEKAYVCERDGVVADPSTWDESGASE